jgi:hypothetical protein
MTSVSRNVRRLARLSNLPIAVSLLLCAACGNRDVPREFGPAPTAGGASDDMVVAPRQDLLPTYPCSSCHDSMPRNPHRRTFTIFHTVRNHFKHGDSERWCYQCHSIVDLDRLVLANGSLVTFDKGYLVCGGCHGDKLRDWKLSVHGGSTGFWNGQKVRRSCPACHNPHDPQFPQIRPEPAPPPPKAN